MFNMEELLIERVITLNVCESVLRIKKVNYKEQLIIVIFYQAC